MIRHRFRHERPTALADAVAVLAAAGPRARVLGGGTLLVPEMVAGEASPDHVVDLGRLGLERVRLDGNDLVLAATATYTDVLADPRVAEHAPVLVAMASGVTGGVQLLNAATLAGSACQAAPGSDVPGCLAALAARFRLASAEGVREVGVDAFFLDAHRTALRPDELLLEIVLPSTAGRAHGYVKLKHAASSWPIATGACVLGADGGRVRVAIGAAGPVPVVLERDVAPGAGALAAEVAALLQQTWDDVLADAGYRRSVAPVAARRALEQAGVAP